MAEVQIKPTTIRTLGDLADLLHQFKEAGWGREELLYAADQVWPQEEPQAEPHPLVGKRIRWTHGPTTMVGKATHHDPDDDELHITVDGMIHARIWVPAADCELFEDGA